MITIKELKALIAKHDDDVVVILSRDAEGNEFSPAEGYSITYRSWLNETEGEGLADDTRCLILWPRN